MTSEYTRAILNKAIAQICLNIGWNATHATPIDLLNDIVRYFLKELCKVAHNFSNQYGRTVPNLDDLGLAFQELGVNISELQDYVNWVEQVPFVHKVPAFPVSCPSKLCHPKPDSRELLQRAPHIPDHLPLLYSEPEPEEETPKNDGTQTNGDLPTLKRPSDIFEEMPPSKRPRLCYPEEEGRPMREMTSVFMSPSGFISPNREGRLPNPAVPPQSDSPVHSPHNNHSLNKESKKDKSKSKKNKDGSSKKEGKKVKSKKENKENSHLPKSDLLVIPCKESPPPKPKKSKSFIKSPSKTKSSKFKKENKKKSKDSSSSSKSEKHNKNKAPPPSSTLPALSSPRDSSSISKSKSSETHITPNKELANNSKVEVKLENPLIHSDDLFHMYNNSNGSSEASPDSRLVIDDSIETQQRQEQESRMAVLDECIDAVIQKGVEDIVPPVECDDTSSRDDYDDYDGEELEKEFLLSSHKKLEPKDVYDFTDTSDSGGMDSPSHVSPSENFNDSPPKKPPKEPKKKKKKSKNNVTFSPKTPPPPPKVKPPEKLSSVIYTDSDDSSSSSLSHPFKKFSSPPSAHTLSHGSFPTPPLFGRVPNSPTNNLDFRPEIEKKEKKNKADKKEKSKKKNKDKVKEKESAMKKEVLSIKKEAFAKKETPFKKDVLLPKRDDSVPKEFEEERFKPEKIKSEKKNKSKGDKDKKKSKEPEQQKKKDIIDEPPFKMKLCLGPSAPQNKPKYRTPSPEPLPVPSYTPPASSGRGRGGGRGKGKKVNPSKPPPAPKPSSTQVDDKGNKIWICPACSKIDDGSPMIGCDECDDWYHWVCVNIIVPPQEEESWYCQPCLGQRQSSKKRKGHRKDK